MSCPILKGSKKILIPEKYKNLEHMWCDDLKIYILNDLLLLLLF